MGGWDEEEDREDWQFRPVWEDEEPEPPGRPLRPVLSSLTRPPPAKAPPAPSSSDDLLHHLSEAEDALSRMDAAAMTAPEAVRQGAVARLAYREASGWLASLDLWVHPHDLALRDLGLTGSYVAAASTGRLVANLPNTLAEARNEDASTVPEDRVVAFCLGLARALRRLAEVRSWKPLADASAAGKAMETLGLADYEAEIAFVDWTDARSDTSKAPPLLSAINAAMAWRKLDDREGGDLRAGFVAAAMVAGAGRLRAMPLPLWTARRALQGMRRLEAPFADTDEARCLLLRGIAEGARAAMTELDRLGGIIQRAEGMLRQRRRSSRMGDAIDAAIRTPCLTPTALGRRLGVTPQAATRLLREMAEAKLVREATGRRSFRAFAM